MRPSPLHLSAIFLTTLAFAGCAGAPAPLIDSARRPAALRFGMRVTPDPAENPIDPPERFSGYHAGLDLEVSEEELDEEVIVYAVCGGSVLYSGFAEGYGGVLVQQCEIGGQDVTVLYGHLDNVGLTPEGITLSVGQPLGVLAPHRSLWSGWNRKHLHIGMHRGTTVDMRGYAERPEELAEFLDPGLILATPGRPVDEFVVPGSRTRRETGEAGSAAP